MKLQNFLLVSAICLSLASCVSSGVAVSSRGDVMVYESIPMAPNVVLTVETPIMAAPAPNYVWIDGYWTWDYNYREYVWVQGHWEVAPYTGAYWIPGYWEYYSNGYRWINATWLPRDYAMRYGYYSGRYDYFGRPVYYQRPTFDNHYGFAYGYDHRTDFRGRGYSSSPAFNDQPRDVRKRENQAFYSESTNNSRNASTSRTSQGEIRIRDDNARQSTSTSRTAESNSGSSRTSTTTNSSNGSTTTPSRSSSTTTTTTNSGSSRSSATQSSTTTTPSRSASTSTTQSGSTTTPARSSSTTTTGSGSSRSSGSSTSSGSSSSGTSRSATSGGRR